MNAKTIFNWFDTRKFQLGINGINQPQRRGTLHHKKKLQRTWLIILECHSFDKCNQVVDWLRCWNNPRRVRTSGVPNLSLLSVALILFLGCRIS